MTPVAGEILNCFDEGTKPCDRKYHIHLSFIKFDQIKKVDSNTNLRVVSRNQ